MSDVRYAGFWIRFGAMMIDSIVIGVPLAVLVYLISGGAWFDLSQYQDNINYAMSGNTHMALNSQPKVSFAWELVFEILILIVTILFWEKWRGATPGKKLVKIKIVDAESFQDISNKQAITRSLGYIVSTFALLLGFIMVAFRKDKRAFHDFLAKTVVIYED